MRVADPKSSANSRNRCHPVGSTPHDPAGRPGRAGGRRRVELVSYALIGLSGWLLSRHIPRRRTLLADQTKKLDRLANAEGIRPRIHPVLGWDYLPDYSTDTDTVNSMGLRSVREYAPEPPPGVRRIAAFGDSFTYAGEVSDEGCWAARVEAGWRAEVLNYGIGGYGPDQVYLRYLDEGHRMKPDVVLIGFVPLMASRVVSRYRRFQDPRDGPWFKPRFVLEGEDLRLVSPPVASREDALRLLENPSLVAQMSAGDFWYVPAIYEHRLHDWSATYRLLTYFFAWLNRRHLHRDRIHKGRFLNPDAESYRILTRLYRKFGEAVRANGAEPVVMLFPTRGDLEMYAASRQTTYQTLAATFVEAGLGVVDLAEPLVLSGIPLPELFAPKGHLSDKGTRWWLGGRGRAGPPPEGEPADRPLPQAPDSREIAEAACHGAQCSISGSGGPPLRDHSPPE